MKISISVLALVGCIVLGVACVANGLPRDAEADTFPDLADRSLETVITGQVYRVGNVGIFETVEHDHIFVTHVVSGSAK